MTTRIEKRREALSSKCQRIAERKAEAAKRRKSIGLLHALHVEAVRQLIKTEIRAEKSGAA